MLDPLPFEAVSALFHDAMRRRPPRLPEDVEKLVAIALGQHEAFRAVYLDDPPIERLKEAAALLFHILAALLDCHERSPGDATPGPASTALLYGEMIRRLVLLAGDEGDLGRPLGLESLEPVGVMFRRVTETLGAEPRGQDSRGEILRSCAEYLNGLAFVLHKLRHFPVVA